MLPLSNRYGNNNVTDFSVTRTKRIQYCGVLEFYYWTHRRIQFTLPLIIWMPKKISRD